MVLVAKILFFCIISVLVFSVKADNSKLPTNAKTPWNATVTDRLKHELLMHYDKFARPTQHYNTTEVNIGMTVTHVDVNELKNTFTVHGWVRMSWKDDKLKWNSTDYEGLTTLHVGDHEIWQPDIVPYNSAAGSTVDHYANTHCLVSEDGTVLWVPPIQFVVFCDINMRLWPFDTQECFVKLGSWTYHGYAVSLVLDDNRTDVHFIIENTEWKLINLTKARHITKYECCAEPYMDVTFNMTVMRRSPSYKALVITPAIAIIAMTLMAFWLPPQAGEKIVLNASTAIIICVFLLYFVQKCPAMGDHTPLIVLFYSSSLYIICFCLIGSICVLCIARTSHIHPLPKFLRNPLTGWLGFWLGLSSYINQTNASHSKDSELQTRNSGVPERDHSDLDHNPEADGEEHRINVNAVPPKSCNAQAEWLLFAAALDRLQFIFWSLIFVILAIAYSV